MRWTFDADHDALYFYLAEGTPASQIEAEDGTIVDLTEEGVVLGVEVLGASHGWDPEVVVARIGLDEATAELLRFLAFNAPARRAADRDTGSATVPALQQELAEASGSALVA